MKTLQAGERVWLILNDAATKIEFQIEYGPATIYEWTENVEK